MNEIQQFLSEIDYNQLFSILLPTTVMCYSYNFNQKYQINRGGDSLNRYTVKNDLNGIFKKNNSEENKKKFKEKFVSSIDDFSKTIEEKSPHVNLSIFNQNLQTLKIRESNFSIFNILRTFIHQSLAVGEYNSHRNSIRINKGAELLTLNHELLHMATNIKNDDWTFTGFNQVNASFKNLTSSSIGEAFNEGYTELLAERYFGQGNSYWEEKHYASLVEKIVGKEKMEQLYFNADLNGLVEELEKYDSKDNIIHFLDNLDYLNENLYYDIKDQDVFDDCSKCFEECSVFVLRCYAKQIHEQCVYGLITPEESNMLLGNYVYDLYDSYDTNKGEIPTISKEKIGEAVSGLFSIDVQIKENNNNNKGSR